MKVKALGVFRSKLFKPCRKLLLKFKLRPKKPAFIRLLQIHAHKKSKFQKAFPKKPMSSLLSVFHSPKKPKDKDRLQYLMSPSNKHGTPLFPSPLTPAFVRAGKAEKSEASPSSQDVEDACRSFESYLVEMFVEEGKTKDLMDVEELLYCWKNLKCPVYIDLVCRFYGELCKDLFSSDSEQGDCSN